MKHLNTIFKVLTVIGFILIAIFSFFLNTARIPIESNFNFTHAVAYCVLTMLGLAAIQKKFSFNWCFFPLFTSAYGYVLEFFQPLFGRHYSLFDAASNATGALIAVIIMAHWYYNYGT